MEAHGFRVSCTPLFEVLFTFPSRYWFAIGLSVVFSLSGWSPKIRAGFLVSRLTQVPPCSPGNCRVRGFHPLRPRFPAGSANFLVCVLAVLLPRRGVATLPVWALPLSLAATRGIIIIFSSCRYWDVSVPCVRPRFACARLEAGRVAPFGHPRISVYLPLPAAFRSLSRPSSPPRAKASPMCPSFAFALSFFCSSATTSRLSGCTLFRFVSLLPTCQCPLFFS